MATVQIIPTVAATAWQCSCGETFGYDPSEWPHFPQAKVNRHLRRTGCTGGGGTYLISHAFRICRGVPETPPTRYSRCAMPIDAFMAPNDVTFCPRLRPGVF